MIPHRTIRLGMALGSLLVGALATAQTPPTPTAAFAMKWCAQCHGGDEPEADLDLVALLAGPHDADSIARLLDVRSAVLSSEMPPEDEPRPAADARAAFARHLERLLADALPEVDFEPGASPVRRLTPQEYANTVFDLLGVAVDSSQLGDEPAFSPSHLERYVELSASIAEAAILTEDPDHPPARRFDAEEMESTLGQQSARGDFVSLYTQGALQSTAILPRRGDYRIRVRAYGDQGGDEPARMGIRVDSGERHDLDVATTRANPTVYEVALSLAGGARTIEVSFLNDYYKPEAKTGRDRNLLVDWVEIIGPTDRLDEPAAQRWIFAHDPGHGSVTSRARPMLEALASRAWRRPARGDEIARLCALVRTGVRRGGTLAEGMRLALRAVLVAPQFLLHIEAAPRTGRHVHALDAFALAARLSFFLWRSLPDAPLRDRARHGALARPDVLVGEARRMLADARSSRLVEHFTRHELGLWQLDEVQPDPARFPSFDEHLRHAMRQETEMFVAAILRERRSVYDLIDADFTFVDATLAAHYGLAGIRGSEPRRIQLADPRRGGLLGHAAMHTLTANPTRTSPVKRGKWVLDHLLDDPPAPPPANVPDLEETETLGQPHNLRAALAQHSADARCAVCHVRMDALGFALERFDAIGRWRDRDNGTPIDASATLPSGATVDGVPGLRRLLRADRALVRGIAKKLFRTALARDPKPTDVVALEGLVAGLPAEPTFEDIIVGLVQLDAFRRRRAR